MSSFDAIRTQFRILDICPVEQQQQQQKFELNRKHVMILTLITLHVIMVIVFLAIEASNYNEYLGSLFIALTGLTSIFLYLLFTWQTKSIFKLIGDLDHFTLTRKICLNSTKSTK